MTTRPPHRRKFDDDDDQWIVYTTIEDAETPRNIAKAFDVHWEDVVISNRKSFPTLNGKSKLMVGTVLQFAPCEEMVLCSMCKRDEFEGQPILFCDEEQCSRGYHLYCLGLKEIPEGTWLCSFCESDGVTAASQTDDGAPPDPNVTGPTTPKGRADAFTLGTERTGRDGRSRWVVSQELRGLRAASSSRARCKGEYVKVWQLAAADAPTSESRPWTGDEPKEARS
jgi:hypothetical protein